MIDPVTDANLEQSPAEVNLKTLHVEWAKNGDAERYWWIEPTVSFCASKVASFGAGLFSWGIGFDELWLWGARHALHAVRSSRTKEGPLYRSKCFDSATVGFQLVYLLDLHEHNRYGLTVDGQHPSRLKLSGDSTKLIVVTGDG